MEGSELGDGCSEFHKYTEGKKRLIPKSVAPVFSAGSEVEGLLGGERLQGVWEV